MKIRARCPVRIDLAGPWTDCPEFFEKTGLGATVNLAIVPLLEGQKRYVRGFLDTASSKLAYEAPPGAGLGASAAMTVLWMALVRAVHTQTLDERERFYLVENSHRLERLLGVLGGKQDQCSAVFGGLNLFTFYPLGTSRFPIPPPPTLKSTLILWNTQVYRLSSDIHKRVWARKKVPILTKMVDLAFSMKEALLQNDLEQIARLINQTWECQQRLDDSLTTPEIEEAFTALKQKRVFWAGKALGAGGGGHVLFMVDPAQRALAQATLKALGGTLVDFEFDFDGLVLHK